MSRRPAHRLDSRGPPCPFDRARRIALQKVAAAPLEDDACPLESADHEPLDEAGTSGEHQPVGACGRLSVQLDTQLPGVVGPPGAVDHDWTGDGRQRTLHGDRVDAWPGEVEHDRARTGVLIRLEDRPAERARIGVRGVDHGIGRQQDARLHPLKSDQGEPADLRARPTPAEADAVHE